jgi:hypothetical protein
MLLQSELSEIARTVIYGSLEDLETMLYKDIIKDLDVSAYENLPVIVKGCSKKPVPISAYMMITEKLQQIASSVMYGEACSSVPVFKKRK